MGKKLLQKIIIYLFEKYAYDYWIEREEEIQRQEYINKHGLQGCSQEEFNQHWIEYSRRPIDEACEQAYNQGCIDTIDKNFN